MVVTKRTTWRGPQIRRILKQAAVALHVVPDVVGDPLPGVFEGTSLLAGGGFPWFADTLDANGAYATTFVPATVFPALVGSPVHLQAASYDPTLQRWLLSNAEVRTPLY